MSPKSRPWTRGSHRHPWARDAILISIGSNGPFGTECRGGRSQIRRFRYSETVIYVGCFLVLCSYDELCWVQMYWKSLGQFFVWLVCGEFIAGGVASSSRKPHCNMHPRAYLYSVLGGSVTLFVCGCTGRRPVLVQEQNAGLWGGSIARVWIGLVWSSSTRGPGGTPFTNADPPFFTGDSLFAAVINCSTPYS